MAIAGSNGLPVFSTAGTNQLAFWIAVGTPITELSGDGRRGSTNWSATAPILNSPTPKARLLGSSDYSPRPDRALRRASQPSRPIRAASGSGLRQS